MLALESVGHGKLFDNTDCYGPLPQVPGAFLC